MTSGEAYWKKNLKLMIGCLIVWFIVSFGFGILLVHPLNNFHLAGYPGILVCATGVHVCLRVSDFLLRHNDDKI
jgi:putative solute:sodium symporter small subunit